MISADGACRLIAGIGADTAEFSQSAAQLVQFQLRGFIGIEKLIHSNEQIALPSYERPWSGEINGAVKKALQKFDKISKQPGI